MSEAEINNTSKDSFPAKRPNFSHCLAIEKVAVLASKLCRIKREVIA